MSNSRKPKTKNKAEGKGNLQANLKAGQDIVDNRIKGNNTIARNKGKLNANLQAGRNINHQNGGDLKNLCENSVDGNRNVHAIGDVQYAHAGRDIGAQAGEDLNLIERCEFRDANTITQARDIDCTSNTCNGDGNNILGRDNLTSTNIEGGSYSQKGGNNNTQVAGVQINNYYHHPGFDALLAAYLELQSKYIALLETKAA